MTEKKRIPFDLERALAGDKVVTRQGIIVSEIYHIKTLKNSISDILAIIDGSTAWFNNNGKYNAHSEWMSDFDLFMAPKVKTYWANVYMYNGDMTVGGIAHKTEEEAKDAVYISERQDHIKTISFEVEE